MSRVCQKAVRSHGMLCCYLKISPLFNIITIDLILHAAFQCLIIFVDIRLSDMKSKESNKFERVSSSETSSGDGGILTNDVSLLLLHLHVFFLLFVLSFTSVLFAYFFIHIRLNFYLSLDYIYSILLVDTPFRIYCYFQYVKFS